MPAENQTTHIGPGFQGRLMHTPEDLLPKSLVGDIFSKAKEESVLMTLGRQVNVSLGETVVSVPGTHRPAAGQVGIGTTFEQREGYEKPRTGIDFGTTKSFMPLKFATMVTASREFALVNPDNLWSQLSAELPAAIARQADLAVVHGMDALRGTALQGIGTNGYINATTNRVTMDLSASASPDLTDQFIAAWKLVIGDDTTDYDVTHWAFAPEIGPDVITARRADGTQLWNPTRVPGVGTDIDLTAGIGGSILGIPASAHPVVTGKIDQAPKTDVRVLAGDWSQLVWGYADQISFRIADQGVIPNGVGGFIDLFSTNQLAVLCEATFGWLVNDPDAFVAMEIEASSS